MAKADHVSTTTTATATCAAKTKSGSRCRRRAAAGGRFCSQHAAATSAGPALTPSKARTSKAAASTSGASKSRPARKRPTNGAVPPDIDETELSDVISELRGGMPFGLGAAPQSLLEDAANVAGFVTENIGRVKDIAVDNGIMDGSTIERFLSDLADAFTGLAAGVAERMAGQYEEDDFGFDERFTESLVPLVSLLYDYYWRVETTGLHHVPAEGRALIVSNHAGSGLPFDGAMIKLAIYREMRTPRHLRMLVLDWLMGLPWLADLMKKTGQVLACSPNATELLKRDELVAVFPEGVKGMAKPFSQRYNLERFGRGGFVRIALKTGAPIIPVAVVGSEEIYPKIGNLPFVNKLIGAPFIPVTPFFPLFGLAGLIPLPSKWHIEFCEPIDVSQYPPEAADDRSFVLELSEQIRATIQERLRDNLLKRSTPFW